MSTQKAYASYQEIIDLHTESDKVSVIGIHTPTGDTPRRMFGGFFDQFKKFRYLGCSISFVPAARLPADPLQVSYEAGEPTIDPRDMLNPIMFHGCHGEDLGAILNKMYAIGSTGSIPSGSQFDMFDADSVFMLEENGVFGTQFDQIMLESLYYRALTDNTWKKAHPQRGFRKSGLRPLIYSLATTHQIAPGEEKTGLGPFGMDDVGFTEAGYLMDSGVPTAAAAVRIQNQNYLTTGTKKNVPQLMTPRLTSLGWLDTYNVLTNPVGRELLQPAAVQEQLMNQVQQIVNPASLPCIFMGVILLPPAYKTEQYFRMIVTHHFGFKQFRGISYNPDYEVPSYFDWNNPDSREEGGSSEDIPDGSIQPIEGESSTIYGYRANQVYELEGISHDPEVTLTVGNISYTTNGQVYFTMEDDIVSVHVPMVKTASGTSSDVVLDWDPQQQRFVNAATSTVFPESFSWDSVMFEAVPGVAYSCVWNTLQPDLALFVNTKIKAGEPLNVHYE